jgi:hypothetical protein
LRNRKRNRSRTGTEVGNRAATGNARQREFDQQFCFRARDQHGRSDAQFERMEAARAGEVGDGFSSLAARNEITKRGFTWRVDRVVRVRDEPCPRLPEHVREQGFRLATGCIRVWQPACTAQECASNRGHTGSLADPRQEQSRERKYVQERPMRAMNAAENT